MDTSNGATILEDSRAGDYYRRAGISTRVVRSRPNVRLSTDRIQILPEDLNLTDVVGLIVYPELRIRKKGKPWSFWGVVTEVGETVVFRNISGEEKGTIVRIPSRYFYDGRVYQRVGISPDE